MEIPATLSIPDYIYSFYADASRCIRGRTPEDVMADALTAYAGMLSADIAKKAAPTPEAEVKL